MKNENQIESLGKSTVSDAELESVIGANQDLYNKLNQLPEIEALSSITDKSEENKSKSENSIFFKKNISKLKSFYYKNELIRYASWALILIFLSTMALTILEYEMFYNDMISDVEGSFTFGHDEPNWLDTFSIHFGGLLLPLLPLGTEMLAQLLI